MKVQLIALLLVSFAFFTSCSENVSEDMAKINELEKAYKANPSKESSAAYVAGATLYASQNPKSTKSEQLLEQAKIYASEQGQSVVYAGIVNELIKQYPSSEKTKMRLADLIDMMDKIGKGKAGNTLKYFYSNKYPEDELTSVFKNETKQLPSDPKAYLKAMAEKIFDNADVGGLNRTASFEYVDASEAYVLVNPEDKEAPKLLFNAAEIAKTVGTYRKALGLYDWIINSYSSDEKAPTAQFLKAFILEDNLKNIDAAKENYELFIKNYPNHHFADDAKFSLDNLGKTNEEIQAELEALQLKNKETGE